MLKNGDRQSPEQLRDRTPRPDAADGGKDRAIAGLEAGLANLPFEKTERENFDSERRECLPTEEQGVKWGADQGALGIIPALGKRSSAATPLTVSPLPVSPCDHREAGLARN